MGDAMTGRPRVLVTGSRTFIDAVAIRDALAGVWQKFPGAVLVSGACGHGADLLAEQCWTHWGGDVERWPADWRGPCATSCPPGHRRQGQRGASFCPAAGMVRNAAMAAAGADICLAFIRDRSRGATYCATTAQRAGIPAEIHRYRTDDDHLTY
ncbi:SLOG family protein [Amycolatopsis sp. NPDC051716]|uniref:SLOG family protein n=1 Tax=Amycolatopsis sp. NPDC051716 TaxID=3155804 RepID=UPI0034436D78